MALDFVRLAAKAHALHRSGNRDEAVSTAQTALACAPADAHPTLELSAAFNNLGLVLFESGYTDTAMPAYERALALAAALVPANEPALANIYNNIGQARQQNGELAEARRALERSVEIRARLWPDQAGLAVGLDNLGNVLASLGELDRAEDLHKQALGIFEREYGYFDVHTATAVGNLGSLYFQRGDLQRAEAFRLRALDARQRAGAADTELDLINLVDLYRRKGDEARADGLINRLLAAGGPPRKSDRKLAGRLQQLAQSCFADFRLDLAERLCSRALELIEALEGPSSAAALKAAHLLANVHRAVGHAEAAEKAYRRCIEGFGTLGMTAEADAATFDLGKFYRDSGALGAAEQLLRRAVTKLRADPDGSARELASALGNLGHVLYQAQRHKEAEALYAEALSVSARQAGPSDERPWLLYCRAIASYHLGKHDVALPLFREAKQLWTERDGPGHPFVATCAANMALAHWAAGEAGEALERFREGAQIQERDFRRTLAIGSEAKRLAYARGMKADLDRAVSFCLAAGRPHPGAARLAAELVLQRKGRVLDAMAHSESVLRRSAGAEERPRLDRLRAVRTSIANLVAPALVGHDAPAERAQLEQLREEEQRLETELSFRGVLHSPSLESVGLDTVQRALPPDVTLLEYLEIDRFDPVRTGVWAPSDHRYVAVVIAARGEPAWFDLGASATIDEQLDAWRSLLADPDSSQEECEQLATGLHARLIVPLDSAISPARHLLVAPDGKLALIPFGNLRSSDGALLSRGRTVSYLSSGRELQHAAGAPGDAKGIVVFAAPEYDAAVARAGAPSAGAFAGSQIFEPLPGTQEEANAIQRLLPEAKSYIGADASVRALCEVTRPRILHIATHGVFEPLEERSRRRVDMLQLGDELLLAERAVPDRAANPMYFSALALSGANRDRGGLITAQQIAGLDLQGTELVVLSACETGVGTVKRGEEFSGLRRALAIAGARTQVTSLWRVSDAATRDLMTQYYRFLLEGVGRAEALQLAQARVAAIPEWRHPAFWAAFVSAGQWDPLP